MFGHEASDEVAYPPFEIPENLFEDVFPDGMMDNFDQEFECTFNDILTDCSTINTNSVDCYFPVCFDHFSFLSKPIFTE